jgi:prepilin-type N-terminal cleavage/methylation domain-containing protein
MSSRGFSLLEMSIGVTITSIVFISFIAFYIKFFKEDQLISTQSKLAKIEAAIILYSGKYGYLPCPAPINAGLSANTFGVSTDCAAAAPSGTTDSGSGNDAIRIGGVPFKTIGLDSSYAFDSWRNRITYVSVKNQSSTTTLFYSFPTSGSNAIAIKDKNANFLHASLDTAYVIISHGEKGTGATNYGGTSVIACDASLESENCNNNGVFIDSTYNPHASSTAYYDDIVRWGTRSQIIKKTNMAVQLN